MRSQVLWIQNVRPAHLLQKKCDWHYYGSTIHPDGRVGACCATHMSTQDFGEMPDPQNFPQLWNNASFQRARRMFSEGVPAPDLVCAQCPGPPVMDFHFRNSVNGIIANAPDWALAMLAADPAAFFSELDFLSLPTAAYIAHKKRENFGHFPRIVRWLRRDAVGDTPRHEQIRQILGLLGPMPDWLCYAILVERWNRGVRKPAQNVAWVGWKSEGQSPEHDYSTAVTLLRLDCEHGFAGIEAGPATIIKVRDAGLVVSSTGIDPRVFLPTICAPRSCAIYLRLEVVAEAGSVVQVFYVPPGETGYSEANSVSAAIPTGVSDGVLRIPAGDLQLPVRLDPANQPGVTIIRELEIRADKECYAAQMPRFFKKTLSLPEGTHGIP